MSQTNIAITQLAQLGFADKVAQETQGNSEAMRQTAQQVAADILKQQKDSIEETQPSEKGRKLKSEKDGQEGGGGARDKGQRRKGEPPPEEAESAPGTPWAGNILNLKV